MLGLTAGLDTICLGENKTLQFTGIPPFDVVFTSSRNNAPAETFSKTGINTNTYAVPSLEAGTFVFTLVSVKDANCTNTTLTQTATVIVRDPKAIVDDTVHLCIGSGVPVKFVDGLAPYTLSYNIDGGPTIQVGNCPADTTILINGIAGSSHTFYIIGVKDDDLMCGDIWKDTAVVYIHPEPTVSMTNTTLCEGQSVEITFTGTPPFELTYTVEKNGASFAAAGLPTTFDTVGASGTYHTKTGTGGIYTTLVPAGEAGSFTFNLDRIADAYCDKYIAGRTEDVLVHKAPTVSMSTATV
jgi:hypothetical protein